MKQTLKSLWHALPFSGDANPLVSVIELHGAIGIQGPGARRSLNFARLEKVIAAAFKPKDLKAVALSINSPGGSPVQSRMIFSAIRHHAKERDIPVLAFIEDVGASGGYILAVAADEIYADDSSIVGSIGVIAAGFGFVDAIQKLGIERRTYTAGENKSTLDPFAAESEQDLAHFQTILDGSHKQFIDLVKDRRGERLTGSFDDTFTGRFWLAPDAQSRGLIDGLAQMPDFLRVRYGKDVEIKKFAPGNPSLFSRLAGETSKHQPMSSDIQPMPPILDPDAIAATLEERTLWARYGR